MPVDYKNSKIYKIESLEGNCVYYGSTTQKLCVRMAGHKRHYRNKRVITSKHILCFDDAKIYLVENYPCNSKEELLAREGYYIKNNVCVNKKIPGRDRKQYYNDNKEQIFKQRKQYHQEHKEDVKKHRKQYYQENKEDILKHQNEYREKNRQLIRDRKRQKHICECGNIVLYSDKSRHLKTAIHKNLLNNPFINFKL